MTKYLVATALAALLTASAASATVYTMDFDIGAGNVSGTIETNGTFGSLTTGDILNWAFTLTSPTLQGGPTDTISTANQSQFFVLGSGLTATATTLSFDFLSSTIVIFQGGSNSNFVCLDGFSYNCSGSGDSTFSFGFGPGGFAESVEILGNTVIATNGTSATVPLPAAMPLALAGIGALVVAGRRTPRAA